MVVAADNLLGVGLYSVEEIAFYARVSRRLVSRWLSGADDGEAVIGPQWIGNEKFVPFLDFVQIMAIREIRQAHAVSLKKIRQLLEIAEAEQGIKHPFALKGITFLWGSELGLKLPDGTLVEASGKHRRNTLLKEVVILYKEDLGYDSTGLANLYHAFHWNGCIVDMNPHIRFGEPIVTSCGYSAQTLYEAALAEGSIEAAAKAYGVKKREVDAACRYFDHLKGNKAA
jgi:uncharacterized protein (DUF433 family)